MATDSKIQEIALTYIGKAVTKDKVWPSTMLGAVHPSVAGRLALEDGELALATAFFSPDSWYAFTTRRIVSQFQGALQVLDPSKGIWADFGNFKGYDGWPDPKVIVARGRRADVVKREAATVRTEDGSASVRFEYETWEASMIPIYAVRYWVIKHPVIDKLMTAADRERHTFSTSNREKKKA